MEFEKTSMNRRRPGFPCVNPICSLMNGTAMANLRMASGSRQRKANRLRFLYRRLETPDAFAISFMSIYGDEDRVVCDGQVGDYVVRGSRQCGLIKVDHLEAGRSEFLAELSWNPFVEKEPHAALGPPLRI